MVCSNGHVDTRTLPLLFLFTRFYFHKAIYSHSATRGEGLAYSCQSHSWRGFRFTVVLMDRGCWDGKGRSPILWTLVTRDSQISYVIWVALGKFGLLTPVFLILPVLNKNSYFSNIPSIIAFFSKSIWTAWFRSMIYHDLTDINIHIYKYSGSYGSCSHQNPAFVALQQRQKQFNKSSGEGRSLFFFVS